MEFFPINKLTPGLKTVFCGLDEKKFVSGKLMFEIKVLVNKDVERKNVIQYIFFI